MNKTISIFFACFSFLYVAEIHAQTQADFRWGNAYYFNLNRGESVSFQDKEVRLLQIVNHYNQLKIGADTIWLKVSRRSIPQVVNGVQIFVADNKNVKALTDDPEIHNLLKKDVLICLSNFEDMMLDPNQYTFPISFNDGYLWKAEESDNMFSYEGKVNDKYCSHPGINFDLHDSRGLEKHWIVAVENSTVIWVEDKIPNASKFEVCVLLESKSQPGIYYVYDHLYNKNLNVTKGDNLVRGELISTAWGDENRGFLHFSVVKSDTVPVFNSKFFNAVNCFAPIYELYFSKSYNYIRNYTKGKISFGFESNLIGDEKNILAFEEYTGKGWLLGSWNIADRVECTSDFNRGNARLQKRLFLNEPAACSNPNNYYDFEINVRNGVYRIRANVGDLEKSSWQKIEFENVTAATLELNAGEYHWTPEKVVKVKDSKLTVRIYVNETNNKPAGISEIVFQQAK